MIQNAAYRELVFNPIMDEYLSSDVQQKVEGRLISDLVKVYPDMIQIVIYNNNYTLPSRSGVSKEHKKMITDSKRRDSMHRSLRRSKVSVRDIVRSNDWDYWCTFTFNCGRCFQGCKNKPCICDKTKCKRYDLEYCRRRMSLWLRRQGNLRYIIVPELHKDDAMHFHALISGYNGSLKDLGIRSKSGAKIYQGNYRAGHCQFVPINKDYDSVAKYITKQYITKNMPMFYGKRRYWTSHHLKRPETYVNGLAAFNLWDLVKNSKPSYSDGVYEIHKIKKDSNIPLSPGVQSSLLEPTSV
ncbi:MAG: hypothetical protein WBP12_05330 [Candidatus Saccharimonas sp.]